MSDDRGHKSLLELCGAAGWNPRATRQASLQEEQEMAAWIDASVGNVTRERVAHEAHGLGSAG
ncbi:hypothetical protein [Bradyrhizobium australiense]|uniref:Uncharacterized protein n=1 Tax=Bradyrhizobium australiense TaxID=2721161 RepID=A0A7Y4GQI9_9BRAD|nr:hypothetical protein [Bradyrhizobium australiense]NOJ40041.1 hypothetical protein [Bradyrhizobium australiense]